MKYFTIVIVLSIMIFCLGLYFKIDFFLEKLNVFFFFLIINQSIKKIAFFAFLITLMFCIRFFLDFKVFDFRISMNFIFSILIIWATFLILLKYKISENRRLKNATLLEKKNSELEQYAHITSHDLQEPLRTITSYVELIEEDCAHKLNENEKKYLFFLKKSTQRIRDLVHSMLLYHKLGGKNELEVVNIEDKIIEVIEDLNKLITESKTIINFGKFPEILAYSNDIKILFQNLIQNSIKYRKQNIATIINISFINRKQFWEFSIKDNGIGIEKKFHKSIFKIFNRLHNNTKIEGTGIGLAICEKIVRKHNGEIKINSKINEGTTIIFTISKVLKQENNIYV